MASCRHCISKRTCTFSSMRWHDYAMPAHQMQALLGCCSCRSAVRRLRYEADGETLLQTEADATSSNSNWPIFKQDHLRKASRCGSVSSSSLFSMLISQPSKPCHAAMAASWWAQRSAAASDANSRPHAFLPASHSVMNVPSTWPQAYHGVAASVSDVAHNNVRMRPGASPSHRAGAPPSPSRLAALSPGDG